MPLYSPLSIRQDLSETSLRAAMEKLGVPTFTLNIAPESVVETTALLRELGAELIHNPMAPYVNIKANAELNRNEWFLQYGDMRVGSNGP